MVIPSTFGQSEGGTAMKKEGGLGGKRTGGKKIGKKR
jgi:hypothetical protein